MAKKSVSVDLLCYFFDNKKFPKGCRGIVVPMDTENHSRYRARVKCRACGRTVELDKQELNQKFDEEREKMRHQSTKD